MRILILIFLEIVVNMQSGYSQKCVHKLNGNSGKVKYPVTDPSDNIPTFALKGEDLSKTCVFFKNIAKKKLTLRFKKLDLQRESITIETIRLNPKAKWRQFKKVSKKSKQNSVNIKGFKYIKITAGKKSRFEMEYSLSAPTVIACKPLAKEVGTIRCSKGAKANSKCNLTCKKGYTMNKFIKKKPGKKFSVTCRKLSARKAIWKPVLNRAVCGKGKKTKKECKKPFQFCVPASNNRPQKEKTTPQKSTLYTNQASSTRISQSATVPPRNVKQTTTKESRTLLSSTAENRSIALASVTQTPPPATSVLDQSITKHLTPTSGYKFEVSRSTNRSKENIGTNQTQATKGNEMTTISTGETKPTSTKIQFLTPVSQKMQTSPSETEPTPPPISILFELYPHLNPFHTEASTTSTRTETRIPDGELNTAEILTDTNKPTIETIRMSTTSTENQSSSSAVDLPDSADLVTSTTTVIMSDVRANVADGIVINKVASPLIDRTTEPKIFPTTGPKLQLFTTQVSAVSKPRSPTPTMKTTPPETPKVTISRTEVSSDTKPNLSTTLAKTTTTKRPKTKTNSAAKPKAPSSSNRRVSPTTVLATTKHPFRRLVFGFIVPTPRIRLTTSAPTTFLTEAYTTNQGYKVTLNARLCKKYFCHWNKSKNNYARQCSSFPTLSTKMACQKCRHSTPLLCNVGVSFA